MPYASVDELPAAVRTKLKGKPKKLRQWMHVWNGEYDAHHDESRAFASAWSAVQKMAVGVETMDGEVNFFLPIAKIDKQARTISGYASTSCLDSDGEVVSQEALKAALPDYMRWANIREMHRPSAVGVAQEANLDSRGLYLTAKIADDTAWQKILDGVYKGFSVGGRKLAKVGNTITKISLVEISVVDRPANPECSFAVNKAASADAPAYLVPESESEGSITPLPPNADNIDEDSKPPEQEPDNDYDDPLEVSRALEDGDVAVDSRTKKILKREFSAGQRKRLASSGAAMSDGSFPIANESDLKNAIRAIGRASNPTATKAHIRSRAKALGLTSLIPDDWASAKKLAKQLAKRSSAPPSPSSAHGVDGGAEAALSKVECSHELDLRGRPKPSLREGDTLRGVGALTLKSRKARMMTETNGGGSTTDLNKLLAMLTKQGGTPRVDPTVVLLKAADEDMKSSRDKRKDAEDDCEKLFALHKAAHEQQQALAKAGGKSKDAFDHAGAMKLVKSIYDNLRGVRTLTKTARLNLAKAAGRVGGEGVVEDGVSDVYEVPSGLRTISPAEMDNLPANKLAKRGDEFVSKSESDALVRAAKAEAEAALLKSMPAAPSGGQRPVTFDLTKFGGPAGVGADDPLMKDINPADLASQDQSTRESAVSKLIGNRVLAGKGQTIFSPQFHGTAGGSA